MAWAAGRGSAGELGGLAAASNELHSTEHPVPALFTSQVQLAGAGLEQYENEVLTFEDRRTATMAQNSSGAPKMKARPFTSVTRKDRGNSRK